jgi:tRNA:m(5)U-54 methyltransferase
MNSINIIGGGLAGVEAAWQAANAGAEVRLFEMRPVRQTPAHRTDRLAEIVCSNSLKSDQPGSASYLLKEELRRGNSLVMEAAAATRVPAGQPCPASGYWFTPAKEDSRAHFETGKLMPTFDIAKYGATIWQWSDDQAPEQ